MLFCVRDSRVPANAEFWLFFPSCSTSLHNHFSSGGGGGEVVKYIGLGCLSLPALMT